ncbi:hypothetical protein DL770_002017 [Monosporascus sp. CRB-9-2]|nr:hypothetical protein DL770_002017 [Monosporascus sp. CRB-9-2]
MQLARLSLLTIALAVLVSGTPAPNNRGSQGQNLVAFRRAAEATPDCPPIKEECHHCGDDFQCETRADCEWCYIHDLTW